MPDEHVAAIHPGEYSPSTEVAERGIRVAGYLIDVLPALLTAVVAWIPILGLILAGLVLVPYWLFRDVFGGSLGKRLLGLKIVLKDGSPAPTGALVLRNLPLIAGPVCMLIPVLGYVLAGVVGGVVILVEAIMLLTQGNRLGDLWAGTAVIRRSK